MLANFITNGLGFLGLKRGRFQLMAKKKRQASSERQEPQLSDKVERNASDIDWFRKVGWGLASVYAIIFAGFITWYLPTKLNALKSSIDADTTIQMQPLEVQLTKIQTELHDMQASETLKKLAASNQQTFASSLSELRKVSEKPPEKVNPDPQSLEAIRSKLRKVDTSSAEYWPTVLQFIQFASAALVVPTNVPPPGTHYLMVNNLRCSGRVYCMKVSNAAVELDGGNIPNSIFTNCRIKFTQHPVGLAGVKFINCIFELPKVNEPSPYLKRAAQRLLASNLTHVKFPPS